MVDRVIQNSFSVGELAPALYARTDLAKYHSAAATVRNFFVDYRGGVSTRSGTQYIQRAYKSGSAVRLIPFQASPKVNYVLEFGDRYVRFYNNRQPILENAFSVTANTPITNITVPGHNYSPGDWVYHSSDGNYYIVTATNPTQVALTNLDGSDATANFVGFGTLARVYTLATPYVAADLALLKFAQNVATMIFCHPSYPPMVLTLLTFNNWTIAPINFGSSTGIPGGLTIGTSLASGMTTYAYTVSAIDINNQESGASAAISLTSKADIRSNAGTIRVYWNQVVGAVSYNVYKADVSYFGTNDAGSPFGFIGNTLATNFGDSNVAPNFAQTPPIYQNPFTSSGVTSITVSPAVAYTGPVPAITLSGGTPTTPAAVSPVIKAAPGPTVDTAGTGYVVGDRVSFINGLVLVVATIGTGGSVLTWTNPQTDPAANPGLISSGTIPANPVVTTGNVSGVGTGARANVTWRLYAVSISDPGAGYASTPSASAPAGTDGTPAFTVTVATTAFSYPAVPQFFQQRLVLAGSTRIPGGFNMSIPGSYYNFNISFPSQSDDAVSARLIAGQLDTIRNMIGTSAGLIILTDKALWLVNGGSAGVPVSPGLLNATIQTYNGSSDVPPIVVNYDVLYVQAKGSIVRDASYNLYSNVYTGSDVSLLSSHLFYGHQIKEWAFAEEPYKLIWAVREDGILLSLTYLKEQEFIGWARSDTLNGAFRSVTVVSEPTSNSSIDAVYTVVDRTINGQLVKYIERISDRDYTTTADCWCVDCAIRYVGAPITTLSGAMHLAGQTVTGLADGKVIPPFVMPASGVFTVPVAASKIIVGLVITAQLKTLAIEAGTPSVQGRQKKVADSVLRVAATLGLKIGTDFGTPLVSMKDLAIGNVGSYSNTVVTDLVTSDVRTYIDPNWNAFGQYAIQQDQPYPATILGVMPGLTIGDQ